MAKINNGGNEMGVEKSNGSRKKYIVGIVVAMIILQVLLIYGVLSDIAYQDTNDSFNEVVVEDIGPSSIHSNKLLTQNNEIKVEIGKVTLIGILMIGTGYLIVIKKGFSEERSEKDICVQVIEDTKVESMVREGKYKK